MSGMDDIRCHGPAQSVWIGEAIPTETLKAVRLVPDGKWTSVNYPGEYALVDDEAWAAVKANFEGHGVDLPIDWNHATEDLKHGFIRGKQAPAAGWIKSMYYDKGKGIYGLVQWNPKGAESIRSGEYVYLSPVTVVRGSDRRVVAIDSAALTTKPAIPKMDRLAAEVRGRSRPMYERKPMATGQEKMRKLVMRLREVLNVDGDVTIADLLQRAIAALGGSDIAATGPPVEVAADEEGSAENAVRRRNALGTGEEGPSDPAILVGEIAAMLDITDIDGMTDMGTILKRIRDEIKAKLADMDSESQASAVRDDPELAELQTLVNAERSELQRLRHVREAETFLRPYACVWEGTARPDEIKDTFARFANVDREACQNVLEHLKGFHKYMNTRIIPKGDPKGSFVARERVIAQAQTDYRSEGKLHSVTSIHAWVNDSLRSADLAPLTKEESERLVVN